MSSPRCVYPSKDEEIIMWCWDIERGRVCDELAQMPYDCSGVLTVESEFFRQLEYKTKWYGKDLKVVGRFIPTSETCSQCGYYYQHLTLDIREWICPDCGVKHDRDVNAAKNILKISVGVAAELQTWRDCKTPGSLLPGADPEEASRID